MNRIGSALLVMIFSLPATNAAAALLQVTFFDAAGDQASGPSSSFSQIDLLSMRLVFDNASGAYQVTFTTSAEHPLFGPIELNANLLNGDLPYFYDGRAQAQLPPAAFKDNFNHFVLDSPQLTFTLTGHNEHLTHWRLGDHIATDAFAFPDAFPRGLGPSGSYGTTIQGNSESGYHVYDSFPMNTTIAEVTAVPLPAGLPFFA